jgi:carboxyl-terminal processing protease
MKSVLRILVVVLVVAIIGISSFLAGFGVNYYLVAQNQSASSTTVPSKFPLMWEAWRLIQSEFYGTIPSSSTLVHGMIRGMLASLGDSHTILVEAQPAQLEQNQLQGSYGGIGAMVEVHNSLLVLLPFPTGPAARAGILPDDILVQIDGKAVTPDMTTDDVETKLRGDVGSTVKLTLHRVGESQNFDVTLTREKIDIPTVQYRMIENSSIAYIQITLESGDTAKEFENALNALNKNHPTGVILDLRNNPGGVFPDPVLSVAGQFLSPNTPVVYERYRDGSEKMYGATGSDLAKNLPLVILVNGGTASDAEILAGALQDNGRGILIGEKTFGKGSVQSLHPLSDKSVLHVTTATWYTPKHNAIDGVGLKPDIAVPLTPDDTKKGLDPQLDRAIEYVKTGK